MPWGRRSSSLTWCQQRSADRRTRLGYCHFGSLWTRLEASVRGHVPSFPPPWLLLMPWRMILPIVSFPHAGLGDLGASGGSPSAFWPRAALFSPIIMGIPCLSGCERPLLILAFTLFKLSAYHGLITRHTPILGQFSLMTIDARTACCPSLLFFWVLPSIPMSSPALSRSWVDLSCLVWSPNCLFGARFLLLPAIRPILLGRWALPIVARPTSIGVLRTHFNIPWVIVGWRIHLVTQGVPSDLTSQLVELSWLDALLHTEGLSGCGER